MPAMGNFVGNRVVSKVNHSDESQPLGLSEVRRWPDLNSGRVHGGIKRLV